MEEMYTVLQPRLGDHERAVMALMIRLSFLSGLHCSFSLLRTIANSVLAVC
jgi:hypothetical protein